MSLKAQIKPHEDMSNRTSQIQGAPTNLWRDSMNKRLVLTETN